jgi:CHAD domain-containing protein
MAKKKWFVGGIKINNSFFTEGKRVLRQRLFQVLSNINNYLKTHNIEDLHQLRISIRRLRYPMEVFINFFPRKSFDEFYLKLNELQDLSGYGRDTDVMSMKLMKFQQENKISLPFELFELLKSQKDDYYNKLDQEVKKFLEEPVLEEIKELIDYNRYVKHK